MSQREAILAVADLRHEDVVVDEWNMTVRIRELCAADVMEFTQQMAMHPKLGMYLIIVACACDEAGQALFTDADIPALQGKKLSALNKLQLAALRVNGMDAPSGVALKKALSEVVTEGSPTASPSN